jgi:hypothetical protein
MKKLGALLTALSFVALLVAGLTVAHAETKKEFKAGDTVYVCSCGAACKCGTVSYKEGKCGCGQGLVKTTLTAVKDGKVYYMVDGKELSAPAAGKYGCACGEGCGCGTISQKPGKCSCGKEMKKL